MTYKKKWISFFDDFSESMNVLTSSKDLEKGKVIFESQSSVKGKLAILRTAQNLLRCAIPGYESPAHLQALEAQSHGFEEVAYALDDLLARMREALLESSNLCDIQHSQSISTRLTMSSLQYQAEDAQMRDLIS